MERLRFPAVWELYLEREARVEGKCFILFQTDGWNVAVQAIWRDTLASFFFFFEAV